MCSGRREWTGIIDRPWPGLEQLISLHTSRDITYVLFATDWFEGTVEKSRGRIPFGGVPERPFLLEAVQNGPLCPRLVDIPVMTENPDI